MIEIGRKAGLDKKRIESRDRLIRSDFEGGKRVAEIAKGRGLDQRQVYRVVMRLKQTRWDKRNRAIYRDWMAKKSIKELVDKYGIRREHIRDIIGQEHERLKR